MRHRLSALAMSSLVLLALAPQLWAANIPSWSMGFPSAPPMMPGAIVVGGTTTLDSGWMPASTTTTITVWPVGGGMPITASGTVDSAGTFSGQISGLVSGKQYWVTVQFTVTDGTNTETIITDYASVTTN